MFSNLFTCCVSDDCGYEEPIVSIINAPTYSTKEEFATVTKLGEMYSYPYIFPSTINNCI
jgi:hypothetical protein